MAIFSTQQIREIDAFTIQQEAITSIELMERAALACSVWITQHCDVKANYYIFCGKGNNGGDGLALARILLKNNYSATAIIVNEETRSNDCKINLDALQKHFPNSIIELNSEDDINKINFNLNSVLIDSLYGTGLNKAIDGIYKSIIESINQLPFVKISIDTPSGLFCDELSIQKNTIVNANYTLSFQYPKLAFLFAENYKYVGEFVLLDIALNNDCININSVNNFYIQKIDIKNLLQPKLKFSHKGNNGHTLLIAGSNAKTGAALLASKAALKTGCGLVTLASTNKCINALQNYLPEAMSIELGNENYISELPKLINYNAIAFGPGVGTEKQTANVLKLLIQEWNGNLILDADALNILSENKTWLSFLKPQTILTPHVKELERLIGKCDSSFERLEKTKQLCAKYNCIVVIKGAHSAVVSGNGKVYFNSTGNPGLAKGGSGDVLTGIIVSLLAQGYSPTQACILGVYIHGSSADLCINDISSKSVLASDVCNYIALAFNTIQKN